MGMKEYEPSDLLAKAKALAGAGKIDEAYELILALSFEYSSDSFVGMREGWQRILLDRLYKRFPNREVYPQRVPFAGSLRRFNLKSREAFLLGCIDGNFTLDEIIAISPVDELDTLRAVARLQDFGLIAFGYAA